MSTYWHGRGALDMDNARHWCSECDAWVEDVTYRDGRYFCDCGDEVTTVYPGDDQYPDEDEEL